MNIIQLPLGEVHPYKNNPRKNDGAVAAVAESIKQYGFLVPLVISADHEIITGHTRFKAAKKAGPFFRPLRHSRRADGGTDQSFRLVADTLKGWGISIRFAIAATARESWIILR